MAEIMTPVVRTFSEEQGILQKFGGEVAGETGVFFSGSITPVVLKRKNLPKRFWPAAHADT